MNSLNGQQVQQFFTLRDTAIAKAPKGAKETAYFPFNGHIYHCIYQQYGRYERSGMEWATVLVE